MEVMAIVILCYTNTPWPASCSPWARWMCATGQPCCYGPRAEDIQDKWGFFSIKNWKFTSKNGEFSASNRGIYPDKLTTELGFLQFQILRQLHIDQTPGATLWTPSSGIFILDSRQHIGIWMHLTCPILAGDASSLPSGVCPELVFSFLQYVSTIFIDILILNRFDA